MSQNNFMKAMTFTERWEGFFSDDATDPGGKTKYGISDAGDGTVDGLIDLDRDGKGDVKVEALTKEQAVDYFFRFYWQASGADVLDLPWAVAVFDTAVNVGVGRTLRWLKHSENPKALLEKRRNFYYNLIAGNPAMKKYKRGWLNRVADLEKYVHILSEEMRP